MRSPARSSLAFVAALALAALPVVSEGAGRWLKLATQNLGAAGNAVFEVGPKRGAVDAVRFRVEKASVKITKIEVTFDDGSTQAVDRTMTVAAGVTAGEVKFEDRRKVRSVAVTYDGASLGGKEAAVELQGLS